MTGRRATRGTRVTVGDDPLTQCLDGWCSEKIYPPGTGSVIFRPGGFWRTICAAFVHLVRLLDTREGVRHALKIRPVSGEYVISVRQPEPADNPPVGDFFNLHPGRSIVIPNRNEDIVEKATATATTGAPTFTTIRVYGKPLDRASAGVGSELDEHSLTFIYCGFRSQTNEIRVPTALVLFLKDTDVQESGDVVDFDQDGSEVAYYDIPINADVREPSGRAVSIGAELVRRTGGTFASLVATKPQTSIDMTDLESMPRDQLFAIAKSFIEGVGFDDLEMLSASAACAGYCQTTRATPIGEATTSDNWGGDCD